MIFDDVLIPWERIFLMRKPKEANALFRSRIMSWAGYASVLQLLARLELIIGTAHLIAETGGIANRPFVALEMGELVSYAGMFKALLRAAEVDCVRTPGGLYALGENAHLRPLITMTSERIINIFEHVATSAPFSRRPPKILMCRSCVRCSTFTAAARGSMPCIATDCAVWPGS